ncbi:MAG: hypothetical protein K0Q90_71 [Paenibacillaceae bacterium]|nr:hypothetical protein [Paenibacillaceae bacterium]
MGNRRKIVVWGTALAAVLTVAGCQEDAGQGALLSGVSAAPATDGTTPSPGLGSPGPEVKKDTAAPPEDVKKLLADKHITPVSYAPGEGGLPALLRVKGLQSPGLDAEDVYRDLFYGLGNALKWAPFRVEDDQGTAIMETDATSPKAFRLSKIAGEAYFFDKESIRRYQPVNALAIAVKLNPLLQAGLNGSWDPGSLKALLGDQDSSFEGYDIYFDEHVEVEGGNILSSILFRKEYALPVIGNLGTASTRSDIESLLGKPPFEEAAPLSVFGYKLEPFYLFFTGEAPPYEIAVYPRNSMTSSTGGPELPELTAANTGENGIHVQQLVDQMREKWPDYEVFSIGRGSYGVTYPHRGIWTDDLLGGDTDYKGGVIQLYGNYEGKLTEDIRLPQDADKLKQLATAPEWSPPLSSYRFRLDEDMVFIREQERLRNEQFIREAAAKDGVSSPNGRIIAKAKDNTTFEHAGLYLLYPGKEQPPREVHIGNFIWNISWLSDRYVIFEASFRGIVGYDTVLNKTINIKTSPDYADDYRLVEIKDGIIRYTDGKTEADLPYSFSENGELQLPK